MIYIVFRKEGKALYLVSSSDSFFSNRKAAEKLVRLYSEEHPENEYCIRSFTEVF